jgi:hypothetical protein
MLTATHKELLQFLMQLESASKLGKYIPSATKDGHKPSGGVTPTQTTGQSNNNGEQNKKPGYPTTGDGTTQLDQHKCGAQTGVHTISKACLDFVYDSRRNDRRGRGRGWFYNNNGGNSQPPVQGTDFMNAQQVTNAPTTGANAQPLGSRRCFNCGQEGHYSAACPLRRTTGGANAVMIRAAGAHVVADDRATQDFQQCEPRSDAHELLFAPLSLGVTVERAMLDSGAECNSIEEDVLNRVCVENGFSAEARRNMELLTNVKELTVFGGGRAPVLGCVSLQVKCGGNVATCPFMVFKGSGFPVLLGLPGLTALGFRFGMPNSTFNMLPLTNRRGEMNVVVDSDVILQPFASTCVRLDLSCVHAAATTEDFSAQAMGGPDCSGRDIGANAQGDEQGGHDSVKEWPSTCPRPSVYVIEQEATLDECGAVLDNSVHDAVQHRTSIPIHLRNVHGNCTVIPEGTVLGTIRLARDSDVQQVDKLATTQLDKRDFTCVEETPWSGTDVRAAAMMPAPTSEERKDYVRKNIPSSDQLTAEQARQLEQLLIKYSDAFSMGLHDLPPLCVEPMQIRLKPGTVPIRQKLRKEPLAAKHFVHEQIMKLADGGIVRPSRSPWLQPITVAAKKPPEMFRLCVDYRLVNEATITECMRMPSIDVLQHGLSGKPFITAIDLTSAYHQLPLHSDSVPVTAFGCSAGTFEYNRVPFGLRNAPFEYQRTLETLLATLIYPSPPRPDVYVANYIDDVVIATTSFEQHLSVLEEFFDICIAKNLRVSIKKSAFGMKEVMYLGWYCSADGIRPNPAKVSAIKDFPAPTDVKTLRSFLGLVNFYHKTSDRLSTVDRPLRHLLSPKNRFTWTSECQQAFERVKSLVVDRVLIHPRPGKDFYMQTDASDYAVGAVLEQYDDEGNLRPIEFFRCR